MTDSSISVVRFWPGAARQFLVGGRGDAGPVGGAGRDQGAEEALGNRAELAQLGVQAR